MDSPNLRALERGVALIAPLFEPGTTIPRINTGDHDVALVATALFRKAYIQARTIVDIPQGDMPEGAIPNVRSMLEGFGEMHYLATAPDARREAQIAFAYALVELQKMAHKDGTQGERR